MDTRRDFIRKVFGYASSGFVGLPSLPGLSLTGESSFETPGQVSGEQVRARTGRLPKKDPVPVGIARGKSVQESVEKAVELGGGLGFIKPGTTVLVKPNVNSDDPHPGTTNPEVLLNVLRLAWQKDPKRVIVADRSGYWGKTIDFMKKTGLYEAAIQGGAEVIPFDEGQWIKVNPPGAESWKNGFRIPKLVSQADSIIFVPVCKTHRLASFTMSIKNFVGILHPEDRTSTLHKDHSEPGFGRMIAEIGLAARPKFFVMDATKVFVSGGPARGDERTVDIVIASGDRVANDVAGLGLLKSLGAESRVQDKSVWEQPQIRRAIELGLGAVSVSEVKLQAFGCPEIDEIARHVQK